MKIKILIKWAFIGLIAGNTFAENTRASCSGSLSGRLSGFVYSASNGVYPIQSMEDIHPGADSITKRAIQRYLPSKDFEDGTIDIFVLHQSFEFDISYALDKVFAIINFHGAGNFSKDQKPSEKGMRFNAEKRRPVRIIVLSDRSDWEPGEARLPERFLTEAEEFGRTFQIEVSISNSYSYVDSNGNVKSY